MIAGAVALLGATGAAAQEDPAPIVRPLPNPAPEGSESYRLGASADGAAVLSWIEPRDEGHAFRFVTHQVSESGDGWGEPGLVAEGADWFVNWVDRPGVAPVAENRLAAWWLVRGGGDGGSYGYGIRFAHSLDGGATWFDVHSAGLELKTTYAGFVSVAAETGGYSAAYLSPAPGAEAEADGMTLRIARFHELGHLLADQRLDPDVCSCCPTSVVSAPQGLVVAYRDRVPEEGADDLRDIALARKIRGAWEAPRPLRTDGWRLNACPTNGPSLSSAANEVVAAWFTMGTGDPEVRVAFSDDAGASFGEPIRVDGGDPFGSTGAALLDDGSAAVVWIERGSGNRSEIRLRQVWPDGRLEPPIRVADAPLGRAAGVPQIVRLPGRAPAEDEAEDGEGEEDDETASAEASEDVAAPDPGERLLVAWRDGRVLTSLVWLLPPPAP